MNQLQVLSFLNMHGISLERQKISPNNRSKNQWIFTYSHPATGEAKTIGGYSVSEVVAKAASRADADRRAKILENNRTLVADDF